MASLTALILLTIFAVNNLLSGRLEIGLVIVFAEAALLVIVPAVRRGKSAPLRRMLCFVKSLVSQSSGLSGRSND